MVRKVPTDDKDKYLLQCTYLKEKECEYTRIFQRVKQIKLEEQNKQVEMAEMKNVKKTSLQRLVLFFSSLLR